MLLLNPKSYNRQHKDSETRELMEKTIAFFEKKGLKAIKADDQESKWHQDFFDFVREEKIFATLLTPKGLKDGARWDMWRISEFNEILGFYGLSYWYAWQVTILGLGPIWMSQNKKAKERAALALEDGGLFAFGLSEKKHGADIYSTSMTVKEGEEGKLTATGEKYYIGNGNKAAFVSTFGKMAATGEYIFFLAEPSHKDYHLIKKIETSGVRPAFVAAYGLENYPVKEEDILSRGDEAWSSALNTVNIGKFELGFASIGIATHAFYEAIHHAGHRKLYGKLVTDFPHVKKLFVEGYARLVASKLFGLRATDYMRVASSEDRRYLLYNPIMKMKVTGEGEKVVGMLHEVIAAKGFEQDTYFEMAIRDIGMLPKLEGTVHVNMALIIKFIKNYFFNNVDYPGVPVMDENKNDDYLFAQSSGSLSKVLFPDHLRGYEGLELSNIKIFKDQISLFKKLLIKAPPTPEQAGNVDFMLANGELFTLIAYAQLIVENAGHYEVSQGLLNQIYGFLVKDFSKYALSMVLGHSVTEDQEAIYQAMIQKADFDQQGFDEVWDKEVWPLRDGYELEA